MGKISEELQRKLDFYEQVYYSLDKPVPLKKGLDVYPVKVNDYYNFYNCYPCLTIDKNVKTIIDESGRISQVANPKGIKQSYMSFLIDEMTEGSNAIQLTNQVMQLFELIFHIKKGYYCPECGKEIQYSELFVNIEEDINELTNNKINELKNEYIEKLKKAELYKDDIEIPDIPKELFEKIKKSCRIEYFNNKQICPECGKLMRDVFSIKTNDNGKKTFMIKDVELNSKEFDELKALVPRQNILDYDGDKYIDPDLKEELELKAKMKNSDYTSPTLEKQLVCVGVGTGYTLEYLQNITMRKLSYLLKIVDKKNMYYAQMQGMMSGMVQFKEDPKHWIFSDDKKNIAEELTSLENFEKKFERVT